MPLLPPLLFCPKCTRYIGVEMRCKYCGYERPNSKCVPKDGQSLWQVKTAYEPAGRPCLLGDVLYACDKGGMLYAIYVASGEATRLFEGDGAFRSEMIVREKRAYLAARAGEVVALNLPLPQGEGVWRFKTDGHASGVAADERRVYVGDAEGKVYALNDLGARCEEAWPKTSVGQRISAASVRWRHLLLVATHHHQGKLIALDVSRGQEVWSRDLHDRCALSPLLVTAKDKASAFVVTEQGKIFSFRLPDGDLEWQNDLKTAINAPPVTDGRFIYLGTNSGKVMALDAAQREPGWVQDFGMGKAVGITVWEGLLFVAGADGALCILDLKSGTLLQRHQVAGGITAGPIISPDGMVFVGSGSKGWIALPWHLGQWRWAAEWSAAHGAPEAAAGFYALCGEEDRAEALWREAKQAERAARWWAGIGESERAAKTFEEAAKHHRTATPGRAAAFWISAADQWLRAEDSTNKERCSKQAALINPNIAHVRIVGKFNAPQFEAGEPGALAVQVQNVGEGEAKEIQFFLGGDLYKVVRGSFEKLPSGQSAFIEFENLIPTKVGERPLTIALQYGDAASEQRQTDFRTTVNVAPPAPGVVVEEDAGLVVVRVPKDAPLPTVRVKGSVGTVKYEVVG